MKNRQKKKERVQTRESRNRDVQIGSKRKSRTLGAGYKKRLRRLKIYRERDKLKVTMPMIRGLPWGGGPLIRLRKKRKCLGKDGEIKQLYHRKGRKNLANEKYRAHGEAPETYLKRGGQTNRKERIPG